MEQVQTLEIDEEIIRKRYGVEDKTVGPPTRVDWVQGDILDRTCRPGPFDLIVERRTVQLYDEEMRGQALAALADRLTPDGVLFSHCHAGWWRPPEPRPHLSRDWFEARGWPFWNGLPAEKPEGQVAWLFTTTG